MQAVYELWYPIALASDIKGNHPFARRVLGIDVVLYRRSDDQLVALHDRCPHRFAPLSMGQQVGDDLACPYHGLRFGAQGRCTFNPHGDGHIPQAATVRAFPVCERHGLVWLWPGKGAANEDLIPNLSFIEPVQDTAVFTGYLHTPARYDVVIDNLLDLTHADFLHPQLLGTNGAMPRIRPVVTERGDGAICSRLEMSERPAMGLFAPFMSDPAAAADTLIDITWWAPGIVHIAATSWQGDRSTRSDWPATSALHLIAPETSTTSHYSFIGRRNFLVDDAAFTQKAFAATHHVFSTEDKPMLEMVQQRMGLAPLWSLKPVLLSSDACAVRVRRRLETLIKEEEALQS